MWCVLHPLFCLKYTFQYMCASLLSLQVKAANGVSVDHSNAMKGHASTRLVIRPSSTSVSSRRPTFYRQVRLHLPFFLMFLKDSKIFRKCEMADLFSRSSALLHLLLLWTSGITALSTTTHNSTFEPRAHHHLPQSE